jgi:hypothetical protein
MDFANRGNRPVQQQSVPQGMNTESMPTPQRPTGKKGGIEFGKISSIFMLFGVAIIAAVLIVALVFGGRGDNSNNEADLIQTDKYQAVFLSSQDGQVYFGKLGVYNQDTYVLQDIYYVRVENPVQPEGQNQQQQANISLAKLGNELHGPQDAMYISRDNVLFWENLKDDGQVVKAITEYKATGGNTNNEQTQNTNTSTQQAGTPQSSDTTAPAGN